MNAPDPAARGEEARDAVAAVLRDQAERAERRERSAPKPRRSSGPAQVGAAVVLAAATTWVWISPPRALLAPPPAPPPPAVVDAGLRMDLYVIALQIERFRTANGHLPDALAAALEPGDVAPDVTYTRLGSGRYRLGATRGDATVVWDSTEPLTALTRGARAVLAGETN